MKERDRDDFYGIGILILLLVVGAVAGACVFAFQAYTFLKSGVWPSISILTALQWTKFPWAHNPTDWLGLHELLGSLSLAPSLSIGGSVPVFVWYLRNRD